ncbi:hypothetical protein N800_06420 [Lysobacter daejeonensis GH1-9]|uniref:L,D-TPase catalytic domain-containing protein n=1 Tax=Lysobacter daejeonensis GH1-9 TaxID=1385517 RepID=A0A0A0EUJ4_9GAMM|nr:L,D-transpeptidase family protein [Lysobacter daejeonensis]KGM54611.1 hypothetical protein N800_06420 [Lysobacter daejeonensis GH1-9]
MGVRTLAIAIFVFLSVAPLKSALAVEGATRVVVDKSDRLLMLYRGTDLLGSYRIALGGEPMGPKRLEGDGRTPEGEYILDRKRESDRYYKAIHISYPNRRDQYMAEQEGGLPGGGVMIHGQPKQWAAFAWLRQRFDWTDGSIALSNKDMDLIWDSVREGMPIEITP